MQIYLKTFYNIRRQQNNFEWKTEHNLKKSKKLSTNKLKIQSQTPINHFLQIAMLQFLGIGAALLKSPNGTNKMNLISGNPAFLHNLNYDSFYEECTTIIHTLTEYEFLILGSKHPTDLFTDLKPILIRLAQNTIPKHRVYRFHLFLRKFPNLHIVWTALKKTLHYLTLLVEIHHLNYYQEKQQLKYHKIQKSTSLKMKLHHN